MLLTGTETLHLAAKQGWALPAFAVYNLEMVQAIVTAAEDADRPVLLLAGSSHFHHAGIDALAVAVGNVHGFTANPVTLDLERLHAIAAQCPVPLVLHGASGVLPGQLRGALTCGVAKVNVNAELRRAYLAAVERSLPQAISNADEVAVWKEGRAAVAAAALRIIDSLSPQPSSPTNPNYAVSMLRPPGGVVILCSTIEPVRD